jgi:hypothetical protein
MSFVAHESAADPLLGGCQLPVLECEQGVLLGELVALAGLRQVTHVSTGQIHQVVGNLLAGLESGQYAGKEQLEVRHVCPVEVIEVWAAAFAPSTYSPRRP